MQYSEKLLYEIISKIKETDKSAAEKARKRLDMLAKPPGSLGRLEELSVQIAGITGNVNNTLSKKRLLVFCADNGVTNEGVSSAPKSVTASQTINLSRGKTGAAVLAKRFGCELTVCDVGVDAEINDPNVVNKKIAFGTRNIKKEAAMTRNHAVKAIVTGIELVKESVQNGADVIGIGEMGIGNTTTSAAVLSVLSDMDVIDVTGRGAGLTDEAYINKINVIKTAIEINRPDKNDVIDVISKVGGFDIAAMTGAFIGCACMRVPAVIDGFISAVAALCAYRLCPVSKEYMIPSHASFEIGYRAAMDALGSKPLFDLDMRLGEGSGCPIAMTIIDGALAVMNDMATFEEAGIDDSYLDAIRNTDAFSVERKTL